MNHFIIKSALVAMSLAILSDAVFAESVSPTLAAIQTGSTGEWTGIYGGLNAGGIFNHATVDSNQLGFVGLTGTCDATTNFAGPFPGLQIGYAQQLSSNIVLGIEGDFTHNTNNRGKAACICQYDSGVFDQYTIKNKQQISLRARIGYALPKNLLPFFTAGASMAQTGLSYYDAYGDSYSKNAYPFGWVVGAGLEWGFATNWSVRAEYFYTDYGNVLNMDIPYVYGLYDSQGRARADLNASSVRLAINYWF